MIMKASKAVKMLKEAKVETWKNEDEGFYFAEISFDDYAFRGCAILHPEDKEYESDIVGYTIAHMRAVKQALMHFRDFAEIEYVIINKAICDTLQSQDAETTDPTFKFRKKAFQAKKKWEDYQVAVRATQAQIKKYLADQDKAIASIKRQRELKDKDNQ